ncbi:hypothetical protein BaRGS_00004673 [Batillaria attramentaria]|uniref:Uncharacterized protein n=1 Tax=Batillaria attramentaria TaxID=370345 RepID=A0ABD0LXU0_9CAEN
MFLERRGLITHRHLSHEMTVVKKSEAHLSPKKPTRRNEFGSFSVHRSRPSDHHVEIVRIHALDVDKVCHVKKGQSKNTQVDSLSQTVLVGYGHVQRVGDNADKKENGKAHPVNNTVKFLQSVYADDIVWIVPRYIIRKLYNQAPIWCMDCLVYHCAGRITG